MRARLLTFIVTSCALTVVGCAGESMPPDPSSDVTLSHHVHMMPLRDGNSHDAIDEGTLHRSRPRGHTSATTAVRSSRACASTRCSTVLAPISRSSRRPAV